MRIVLRFSAEAEAAAQRYGLLVEGWRALYRSALEGTDFGTERQVRRVTEQAYAMARRFLETERELIAARSAEIASEATRTTLVSLASRDAPDFTDAVSDHLSAAERYLDHELSIQVERDIAFLVQSLRRTYLQVAIAARSTGMPPRAALIQYQVGNATELHFFFHDRQGQKWPSRKFVRAIWRHHLLSLYNEVVLLILADHGVTQAQVENINPTNFNHGMIIAMSSGSSLPTYSEIRNEVFHPNSDAILKRVEN